MADFGGRIVQPELSECEKENPPRMTLGGLSNPARSEIPRRDLDKSLREVAQARDLIGALARIDERLTAGEEVPRTEDLLNFYRAVWSIFDELGAHAAEDRARRDFETLTGESWVWFSGALDALGFALLPPARKHLIYKMGGGVMRGDVEGWNAYPGEGGLYE